jgi:lipoprotein-anchoring transpeptidase ErfK/SrfK
MKKLALLLTCLAFTVHAEDEPPVAKAMPVAERDVTTQLQIFLDQQLFGPGKIDGAPGEFVGKALKRYQRAHGLPETGVLDKNIPLDSVFPVYTTYTFKPEDEQFVGVLPTQPSEQAKLKKLLYPSLLEFLTERYHCSPVLLAKLNKGLNLERLKPGDTIRVPNVEPFVIEALPKQGFLPEIPEFKSRVININRREKMLDVMDGDKLLASVPITPGIMGGGAKETPAGAWKILGIATSPTFRWDKGVLEYGKRTDTSYLLPPGPRNPVGVLWIGLNKPGIGIHGTNVPQTIGHAQSHGCMRVANSDVVRISKLITKGMTVNIQQVGDRRRRGAAGGRNRIDASLPGWLQPLASVRFPPPRHEPPTLCPRRMKPISWDEGSRYDDPNLRWGSPSYRLEPGDPGYVPWPPEREPKRKRQRPSLPKPTNLPENMDPFPYITRTGTQGQITTGPDYRGTKSAEEVFAEIQTRLGATPLTIQSVLTTFHEIVIDWCKQGWKVAPIADLLGYRFTSGGSEDDSDFQPTFANLNIAPAAQWGEAGRARAEAEFSAENTGHQGRIIPVVIRVTDNWSGLPDKYTAAKSVLIELGNRKGRLEFDRANGSKVQFRKADNSLIEASDYGEPGRTKITAQVPAGTTGPLTVVVTMMINGALRTGEYPETLTAA